MRGDSAPWYPLDGFTVDATAPFDARENRLHLMPQGSVRSGRRGR